MKILVIDNYDSFTYNLVYILRQKKEDVDIYRNDKITPAMCDSYDAIILSPGPGIPKDAGNLMSIITHCTERIPILGICLGHQAIAEFLKGSLTNMPDVYHGIQSDISIINSSAQILRNLPNPFKAGRYHSWEIDSTKMNDTIDVIALSDDKSIMAIQNEALKLYGIQFHPESILTPEGHIIIQNFLDICKSIA